MCIRLSLTALSVMFKVGLWWLWPLTSGNPHIHRRRRDDHFCQQRNASCSRHPLYLCCRCIWHQNRIYNRNTCVSSSAQFAAPSTSAPATTKPTFTTALLWIMTATNQTSSSATTSTTTRKSRSSTASSTTTKPKSTTTSKSKLIPLDRGKIFSAPSTNGSSSSHTAAKGTTFITQVSPYNFQQAWVWVANNSYKQFKYHILWFRWIFSFRVFFCFFFPR